MVIDPTQDATAGGIFDEAWEVRMSRFARDIYFFVPSIKRYETSEFRDADPGDFVPVSITGSGCQLGCDHC